jgi:hypothetical protein
MSTITGIGFDARHPCPDHNIMLCSTCTRRDGECDYGGCAKPATVLVEVHRADGSIGEVRPSCSDCVGRMGWALPTGCYITTTNPERGESEVPTMAHIIETVEATPATEAGALDGFTAICSCGYRLSTSLGADWAKELGGAHVDYMARTGR